MFLIDFFYEKSSRFLLQVDKNLSLDKDQDGWHGYCGGPI